MHEMKCIQLTYDYENIDVEHEKVKIALIETLKNPKLVNNRTTKHESRKANL